MKGRLIVLWLLIICIATGNAHKRSKENKVREPKCSGENRLGCIKMWLPVCGSDGVTYANECILCKENREFEKSIMVTKQGPC